MDAGTVDGCIDGRIDCMSNAWMDDWPNAEMVDGRVCVWTMG